MLARRQKGPSCRGALRVERSGPVAPSFPTALGSPAAPGFRQDVLKCNRCGGRRVVLAFLSERRMVKAILQHLGLPTTGPPVAPARGSPQMELVPWPDERDEPDDSPECP